MIGVQETIITFDSRKIGLTACCRCVPPRRPPTPPSPGPLRHIDLGCFCFDSTQRFHLLISVSCTWLIKGVFFRL